MFSFSWATFGLNYICNICNKLRAGRELFWSREASPLGETEIPPSSWHMAAYFYMYRNNLCPENSCLTRFWHSLQFPFSHRPIWNKTSLGLVMVALWGSAIVNVSNSTYPIQQWSYFLPSCLTAQSRFNQFVLHFFTKARWWTVSHSQVS